MCDVIVLSSSEDEAEIIPSKKNKNDIPKDRKSIDSDFNLSELPQANFNDICRNVDLSRNDGQEKDSSFSDILEANSSRTESITNNFEEEDCILSDFPEVNVNEIKNSRTETTREKKDGTSGFANTNAKSSHSQDGSQSDSDYESQNNVVDYWGQYMSELKNKYNVNVDLSSDEDNKLEEVEEEEKEQKNKKKGGKYYQS